LSLQEQVLANGLNSLSLYTLKQKIVHVVDQFYNYDTHLDFKSSQKIKFDLTANKDYAGRFEMSPHELMIAAVDNLGANYKFNKIFGDHKHTLADVQQHCMTGTQMIVVY